MGMKVNLLAEGEFHRNGIYNAGGYKTYYYNKKLNDTKLLFADLQAHSQSRKIYQSLCKRIDHTIKASTGLSKILEQHSKFSTKASDTHVKNIFTTQKVDER